MSDDEEYSITIVPAAPGFVFHKLDTEQPRLSRPGHAIVAWAIQWKKEGCREPIGSAIPVSTDGFPIDDEYVIEQPDGSFVQPDGELESSFTDMRDALGEFNG